MAKPKRKGSEFTLDGKPFALARTGSVAASAAKVLDRLPEGSLLTSRELAHQLGCTTGALSFAREGLTAYHVDIGNKRLWGSKLSIHNVEALLASDD